MRALGHGAARSSDTVVVRDFARVEAATRAAALESDLKCSIMNNERNTEHNVTSPISRGARREAWAESVIESYVVNVHHGTHEWLLFGCGTVRRRHASKQS